MELSTQILSNIIHYMKYSRHLPKQQRRETWIETCTRNMDMHIKKYPQLTEEIKKVYQEFVFPKKVLPSMRGLQFGGKAIEKNPARGYNCSFLPIDSWEAFHEVMFLLLCGSGVGYSVQRVDIDKLPDIKRPSKRIKRYLISDSIEGWSDAVKVLIKSYFFGTSTIEFDYSDIRERGTPLKTSGGKAPGPQPLKDCIHNLQKVLDTKSPGEKLTSLEVHDMVCFISDAVLSGGIRRSSLISIFNIDDEDMLTCKFGDWWELNPQRARANNTAMVLRHKITKEKFFELWEKIKKSGSGEPAIYLSNDYRWGFNPCNEAALRPYQYCNLTTTDASDISSQQELNNRVCAASFVGTLQAGYTDFHYLRDIWRETTEKDSLLGVSMTGIASGNVLQYDLSEAAQIVKEENARVAKIIGINKAARTSLIKPEGTASLLLGTSSGIHAWHSPYYIRRVTVMKNEPIYEYLKAKLPELIEDDFFKPHTQAKILIPMKAPTNAVFRTEPAVDLLERVKKIYTEWIKPGHRKGDNTHNVSCTVTVKPDEWDIVGNWMWNNKENYNGLSVLPEDLGSYVQAPFTECTKEEYEALLPFLKEIHLDKIKEDIDNTDLKGEVACGGSGCEIT